MPNSKYPKPDDRSNNVERIREIVRNTEDNLHEAEISMEFADQAQRAEISAKNERREQSIEALKEEMQDEIAARKKGKA
ncbi:MAG: small acid-soluble spore protein Tlp [Lysinibacillus sp.]